MKVLEEEEEGWTGLVQTISEKVESKKSSEVDLDIVIIPEKSLGDIDKIYSSPRKSNSR